MAKNESARGGDLTSDNIRSQRLEFISLTPDFLKLSLKKDYAQSERLIGIKVHREWFNQGNLIALRLKQLDADPSYQPWSVRAMMLRSTRQMVGQIGFHTAPCAEYLKDLPPNGVELGYMVYSEFRRKGYATEAVIALMKWAREHHGIRQFIASISPSNVPSLRMSEKLGFRKIGSQIDELDGPEDIYELNLDEHPV